MYIYKQKIKHFFYTGVFECYNSAVIPNLFDASNRLNIFFSSRIPCSTFKVHNFLCKFQI